LGNKRKVEARDHAQKEANSNTSIQHNVIGQASTEGFSLSGDNLPRPTQGLSDPTPMNQYMNHSRENHSDA
jgi:hypothetical protein